VAKAIDLQCRDALLGEDLETAASQSSTVNRLVAAPARSMAIDPHDTSGGSAPDAAYTTGIDSRVTTNFAYERATELWPGFSLCNSHVLLNSAQLKLVGLRSGGCGHVEVGAMAQ